MLLNIEPLLNFFKISSLLSLLCVCLILIFVPFVFTVFFFFFLHPLTPSCSFRYVHGFLSPALRCNKSLIPVSIYLFIHQTVWVPNMSQALCKPLWTKVWFLLSGCIQYRRRTDPKEMSLFHCAQSCLILWGPMECSPPASLVHGIFQARVGCQAFLQGVFLTQDWTWVFCSSCIDMQVL